MGYAVYENHGRWAGYGVPAKCDVADCNEDIDRGLGYRCDDFYEYTYDEDDNEHEVEREGCGLFFCGHHLHHPDHGDDVVPKPDTLEWEAHMLTDESWEQWRDENPAKVAAMRERAAA